MQYTSGLRSSLPVQISSLHQSSTHPWFMDFEPRWKATASVCITAAPPPTPTHPRTHPRDTRCVNSYSYNRSTINLHAARRCRQTSEFCQSIIRRNACTRKGITTVSAAIPPYPYVQQTRPQLYCNHAILRFHIQVVSIDASPCVADNSWEGVGWYNNCKWWDMHAYNTSKVDSFCNMYTYR